MRFLVETQKGEKETHAEEKEKGKGRKGGGAGKKRRGPKGRRKIGGEAAFPGQYIPQKVQKPSKKPQNRVPHV